MPRDEHEKSIAKKRGRSFACNYRDEVEKCFRTFVNARLNDGLNRGNWVICKLSFDYARQDEALKFFEWVKLGIQRGAHICWVNQWNIKSRSRLNLRSWNFRRDRLSSFAEDSARLARDFFGRGKCASWNAKAGSRPVRHWLFARFSIGFRDMTVIRNLSGIFVYCAVHNGHWCRALLFAFYSCTAQKKADRISSVLERVLGAFTWGTFARLMRVFF